MKSQRRVVSNVKKNDSGKVLRIFFGNGTAIDGDGLPTVKEGTMVPKGIGTLSGERGIDLRGRNGARETSSGIYLRNYLQQDVAESEVRR
jgi:hypothetical protein